MKLKAFVSSLDEVDEKYRDLYVASGDGFMLAVDGITTHPEVTALSNAHNRTKTRNNELINENRDLKAKADQLPEDFDADLYERAQTEGVGGGKIKNEEEVRREAAEAATRRAEAAHSKAIGTLTDERDRLKARVERDTRNLALGAALDAAKVTDPALRRGAAALLGQSLKVIETDDGFEALASDPVLGDIPVADYVKTWAGSDEGKAYVAPRESEGGGANGGGQGGNAPNSSGNPWLAKSFNVTEQARIRRENPDLATKLSREAGITLK